MGFSGNVTSRDINEFAGVPLRAQLKPVYTKPLSKETEKELDLRVIGVNGGEDYSSFDVAGEEEFDGDNICTTPTGEESRIRTTCPPAPRKRKAVSKCNYGAGVREFFNPPDLESIFVIGHVQSAK